MAEQDTQDSSEYGRATVPAEATACGTRIVVCVSKFGSLALVCAENPGAFLGTQDAQDEGGWMLPISPPSSGPWSTSASRSSRRNWWSPTTTGRIERTYTGSGPRGGTDSSEPSDGHAPRTRPVPARQPSIRWGRYWGFLSLRFAARVISPRFAAAKLPMSR